MNVLTLRIFIVAVLVLLGILAVGILGFFIPPKNFSAEEIMLTEMKQDNDVNTLDVLEKYMEKVFTEEVYEMKTSVVWGKAKLKVKGINMPARFITYYIPGSGFFRYIEITWYGIPIVTGYDLYYEDTAEFCIAGSVEVGEKIKQGQNLALWAETIWTPSAYFTDERLVWEKAENGLIDLIVPYEDNNDIITISIDSDTGLIDTMEAMRYKGQGEDKTLWEINFLEWSEIDGILIPSKSSVKWEDEKMPWSVWNIEGIIYNIQISDGFELEKEKYLGVD